MNTDTIPTVPSRTYYVPSVFWYLAKKSHFFSGSNVRTKNWLVIILLIIIVFCIGAVFIILIIVIGEINKTTTTAGTVLSGRKEYVGSFFHRDFLYT